MLLLLINNINVILFSEIINAKVISKTDKRLDDIDISYLVYQL